MRAEVGRNYNTPLESSMDAHSDSCDIPHMGNDWNDPYDELRQRPHHIPFSWILSSRIVTRTVREVLSNTVETHQRRGTGDRKPDLHSLARHYSGFASSHLT